MILTSLSVALGMALLGASSYIPAHTTGGSLPGLLNYLPLISVNIVAVSYQLGLGPISWSYSAELFPVDMRSSLSGYCSLMVNTYIFLSIKTFPGRKSNSALH